MKKLICCLLVLSMLIPIWGCSENETGMTDAGSGGAVTSTSGLTFHGDYPYTTYEKPAFTPGTLESDLLTVENGNYDRASRTGNGYFLEIGTGLFYLGSGGLHYADFSDLTNWVLFCDDPDCAHNPSSTCSAGGGRVFLNEEMRLWFIASDEYRFLAPGYKHGNYMAVSMDLTGNDVKLEHIWPEANYGVNGGIVSSPEIGSSGYVLTYGCLDAAGNSYAKHFVVDKALGQVELTKIGTPGFVRNALCIFGDTAYICWPYTDRLYLWIKDGELVQATLPELPLMGGHWSGSTVRFYRTNDGYYDYDLQTGQETRIADVQVDDAAAWIIEPNCILETTLFESMDADERASVRTHTMKLFDGQTWHDVTLPDDIASGRTRIEFQALTSDSIILNTPDGEGGDVTFYRIALGQDTYTLEQIGQFTAE